MTKIYAGMMNGRPYFDDETLQNLLKKYGISSEGTFVDYVGKEQLVPQGVYKIADFLQRDDIKHYIAERSLDVPNLWFKENDTLYIGYSLFFEYLYTFNVSRCKSQEIYYEIKDIEKSCS